MAVLQVGLVLAALAAIVVGAVSWQAGYTPEIAIVRGVVASCVVGVVGYVGELIVGTAPGRPRPAVERLEPLGGAAPRAQTQAAASPANAAQPALPELPAPTTSNDGTAGRSAA